MGSISYTCNGNCFDKFWWKLSSGKITDYEQFVLNNFCEKFSNLNWFLCCDHSLESSRRDDSNECHNIGIGREIRMLAFEKHATE